MGRIRLVILILLSLLVGENLKAQEAPKQEIEIENFIERLFPVQDLDLDYESIYEVLFQLYQNPINLNTAEFESLQATYLLNPRQIQSLIDYRNDYGDFLSLYELQSVPGLDLETIQNLLPFVTLDRFTSGYTKPFLRRLSDSNQAYMLLRHRRVWETRKGFTLPDTTSTGRISSRYLGDANNIYSRFRLQKSRDFSLGFTLDKDEGEQFIWDGKTNRYGFNFYSFHLTKWNAGRWKSINIGDFQAAFGQGLVFGAGFTLGKGAETVSTTRRSSIGLLPYTAALEFGFFRGIGATYQFSKSLSSTVIASHVSRDGRVQSQRDSLEDAGTTFTSLNQSGLHRTASELETKNRLKETSLGVNLEYKKGSLSLGINSLYTQFNRPWLRSPTPYNQFEFRGRNNLNSSIYFNYNLSNHLIFGETAISSSGGIGTVIGIISSLSKWVDFTLLYRSYSRNYHSFYSNAFSEGTRPINERGFYLGLGLRPFPKWEWKVYYDFFRFPWLRYRSYAPSTGYEWLSRLTYKPSKTLSAFFQLRQEQKDRNIPDTGDRQLTYQLASLNKLNGILNLDYQVSEQLFLRSKLLFSRVHFTSTTTNGMMLLQDVKWGKGTFRLTGRVAIFDTDNYDNRLYAFENNVLWAFSVPAFSGSGLRYYLLGQYKVHRNLTLYFRIARTSYSDREQISSGLQTIEGNTQTETNLLLKYGLFK